MFRITSNIKNMLKELVEYFTSIFILFLNNKHSYTTMLTMTLCSKTSFVNFSGNFYHFPTPLVLIRIYFIFLFL